MKYLNKLLNDKGSLTMELAFVTPVLLILVIGSIFMGITYINKSALLDASFIGAKSVSYYGGDTLEAREDIFKTLDARYLSGAENVQVTVKYQAIDGTDYEQTQSADVTEIVTPIPAMPGTSISVSLVSNNYNLRIPFLSTKAFDLIGTSVSRNSNK